MHIVFISYWGLNQGLTKSTVLPHLEVLAGYEEVEKLTLITFERAQEMPVDPKSSSWNWIYIDESKGVPGLAKFMSIRSCYKKLISLNPDFVIARSSLAGIAAYRFNRKTKTPYSVESFEPHAQYMADSKEWRRGGLKYRLLEFCEKRQMETADFIMPVSNNYLNHIKSLVNKNVRLKVLPCTVNFESFRRSSQRGLEIRKKLGIDHEAVVGVYVGKFGGLYLEGQAFAIMREALKQFEKSFLIVLTPSSKVEVEKLALESGFSIENMFIQKVDQDKVSNYLSASDLSFVTVKSSKSSKYCSAVKTGEYLMNGLYVITTNDIGDDSDLITQSNCGCLSDDLRCLKVNLKNHKPENSVALAKRTRGRHLINEAYDLIIDFMKQKKGA